MHLDESYHLLATADHLTVEQAMQQCIQRPGFGQETDAICGWFYDWYRSDAPLLQRFVSRYAADIAKRYLFHCLSTSETDPVPGLEVRAGSSAGYVFFAPKTAFSV